MKVEPVVLEGFVVRLVPVTQDHIQPLSAVGLDGELWRWTTTRVQTPQDMRAYIETALRWQAEGTALPFAIEHKKPRTIVGSTRFANIDRANRRVEIGWTWITRAWQRTAVNTESKYLMLRHAFEVWRCIRVEFKTDALNTQSRAALLRIGAVEEGVFRNHMVMPEGRLRNSVYYSIIDSEWAKVKAALEDKLQRRSSADRG